jgi:hypothetical protein
MRGIIVLSIAALLACASTKTVAPGPATRETIRVVGGAGVPAEVVTSPTVALGVGTVSVPIDRVWTLLPAVYESVGVPIEHLDPATHVIGNDGFKLRRALRSVPLTRYLDCGSAQAGPSAETYDVYLTVLTELHKGETEGTIVATTVQAMAKPATYAGDYVRCSSTGRLEARILDDLKARLAAG